MKKPSKVLVNNTQEFLIGEDRIQSLDILKGSDSAYHLLQGQKSILARVVESDFNNKAYTININSNNYTTGLYFVQILNAQGIVVDVKKIILQ